MAKETVKHTTFGKRDGAQSESAGLPPRTNAVHELQSLLSNTFWGMLLTMAVPT